MRMSQAEKDRSHARIVASASRLFRERGLDGASVSDVMKDAGMTHGGFYKHFANKDALVESALSEAFSGFLAMLDGKDQAAGDAYRERYLSEMHVENPGFGCPVAALAQEVGRGPAEVKTAFGSGVNDVVDALAATMNGPDQARRTAALQQFSMLVGAVVIARAVGPQLGDEVIAAVSQAVGAGGKTKKGHRS
jgi:TetR/AcrR family transcriptional repressor of nem operon